LAVPPGENDRTIEKKSGLVSIRGRLVRRWSEREDTTMKVMVIVKATRESEAGRIPNEDLFNDMDKFNEELSKAGILLAAEGLQPSSKGVRVRFSGTKRTVTDGPFAETKELIAGFWLWEVKSMEEAIEWVKRCPNPMESDSDIEIRGVFGPEEFERILEQAKKRG
jgi:hypothetical protein